MPPSYCSWQLQLAVAAAALAFGGRRVESLAVSMPVLPVQPPPSDEAPSLPSSGPPNPHDAYRSFDCALRRLALDFAMELQGERGRDEFQRIAGALNEGAYAECRNLTVPAGLSPPSPPAFPLPAGARVYVDYAKGLDSNEGSEAAPLKTLAAAVEKAVSDGRRSTPATAGTVVLRGGTHYLSATVQLTARHSGLTIVNYPHEEAFLSGAVPLEAPVWKPLGAAGIFATDLTGQLSAVPGLRLNGGRAIRARYPNFDPENGFGPGLSVGPGWGGKGTRGPNGTAYLNITPPAPLTKVNPTTPNRNDSGAMGSYQRFNLGIGGPCMAFSPPAGYWCGVGTAGGGGIEYTGVTTGLVMVGDDGASHVLPRFPYPNSSGAVVHMFRPQAWASWMFEVGSANATTLFFSKGGFQGARGCGNHQGDFKGCGAEFYIENVYQELDVENEWYFNDATRMLYFHAGNGSDAKERLDSSCFEATRLKQLLTIVGNQSSPVTDITIKGIGLKDTAITFLDPHEAISGGDWTLVRGGALFVEGAREITIEGCNFTRLDSNALTLSGYTRGVRIIGNVFTLIGGNTISLMGKTTMPDPDPRLEGKFGWDGRNGEQPRFTTVYGNLAYRLGIWEKQSSFYFQGKSCQNNITANIVYGDPRCAVNFDDGFGGGSTVSRNLFFATSTETNQGVFNSWDRQFYLTDVDVAPGTKQWDEISHNLMIDTTTIDSRGPHAGMEAIDNDDGSSYYKTHGNVFAYSLGGMKNDIDGHDNWHYDNVYLFVSGPMVDISTSMLQGHEDHFFNNTVVATSRGGGRGSPATYELIARCHTGNPVVYDNRIYTRDGNATQCKGPLINGTTVGKWPSDQQLISLARLQLEMPTA